MIEADDLDGKRAAEAGETAAERKCNGKYRLDVDAEAARHALIVDGGAYLRAEVRVLQHQHQQHHDHQSHGDQKQPVDAEADAQ